MFLEVRPSEGGDDASSFAGELFDALICFARFHGCEAERLNGFSASRTLTAETSCPHLSAMSGTHRIQRIPPNDPRGRRHTSTVTVALVAAPSVGEAGDLAGDCDVETTRGSGNGGQHRQKNDTAVRVRHRPSGLVVFCDDQRSQWQNRQQAFAVLRSRLREADAGRAAAEVRDSRRSQFASGERPVKQWTWNTQRGEVLDHSTGRKWRLKDALKGRINP